MLKKKTTKRMNALLTEPVPRVGEGRNGEGKLNLQSVRPQA